MGIETPRAFVKRVLSRLACEAVLAERKARLGSILEAKLRIVTAATPKAIFMWDLLGILERSFIKKVVV
jgi:hypothetical protein